MGVRCLGAEQCPDWQFGHRHWFSAERRSGHVPSRGTEPLRWDLQLSQSLNALRRARRRLRRQHRPGCRNGALRTADHPREFLHGRRRPQPLRDDRVLNSLHLHGRQSSLDAAEVGGAGNSFPGCCFLPLAGTDSVAVIENADAASGTAHQGNVPVTAFHFTPPAAVPVPATLLLVSAVAGVGAARAWRRRR